MKNLFKLLFVFLTLVFYTSCGKHKENKQEHSQTEEKSEHKQVSKSMIDLDNGNLWSANIETTQGINNMINLMNSFSDKESVEAYNLLDKNLEKEFNTILTKCTMEGESHNQLHNYLVPMKEMFESLSSSDLNTCKENYNKLNNYLKEYSKYFD